MEGYRAYQERLRRLLGDQDPVAVLQTTPSRLEELRERLGADGLARSYRAGAWTGAQLLAHLADSELFMGFRLRQVLAHDDHLVQAMDQDAWARPYARLDPDLALGAFRAVRAWNLSLLARLDMHDWLKTYRHPELEGTHTVDDLVRHLAAHDLNHLQQLETIASG